MKKQLKKQLVAFIYLNTIDGKRTYGCFDKNAKLLTTYTVHDSGMGARIALEAALNDFKVSDANWIHKVREIVMKRVNEI